MLGFPYLFVSGEVLTDLCGCGRLILVVIALALTSLGISQIIAALVGFFMLRRYAEQKQAEIEHRITETVAAWVAPGPDKTPSQLSQMISSAGGVIGTAAAHSIMYTLAARDGQAGKVASGLADELQAKSNPIYGLLSGGKRGKGAAVNRLAEILGPMLAPMLSGKNGEGERVTRTPLEY
jgi:hypothetical protein